MIRSRWIGPLFGFVAWTGIVKGQQPVLPEPVPQVAVPNERILSVQEPGKPVQKYRILGVTKLPDGAIAYRVQSLTTSEILTLIGPARAAEKSPAAQPEHPVPAVSTTQASSPRSPFAPASVPVAQVMPQSPFAPSLSPPTGAMAQAITVPSSNGSIAQMQARLPVASDVVPVIPPQLPPVAPDTPVKSTDPAPVQPGVRPPAASGTEPNGPPLLDPPVSAQPPVVSEPIPQKTGTSPVPAAPETVEPKDVKSPASVSPTVPATTGPQNAKPMVVPAAPTTWPPAYVGNATPETTTVPPGDRTFHPAVVPPPPPCGPCVPRIKPCEVVTCPNTCAVCGTPSVQSTCDTCVPEKTHLFANLFKRSCDCPPATTDVKPVPQPAPKPDKPPVAKVPTAPATPDDWRHSWGNTYIAPPGPPPLVMEAVPAKPVLPPIVEAVPAKPVPLPVQLPAPVQKAETAKPVPVAPPPVLPAPEVKETKSKIDNAVMAQTTKTMDALAPKKLSEPAGPPAASLVPQTKQSREQYPPWSVDAKSGNAFTPPAEKGPPQGIVQDNAFTKVLTNGQPYVPPGPMPQGAAMGQGMPYPPMMGQAMYRVPSQMPMAAVRPDEGVPEGMNNAFTQGGTTRPIPSDFGAPTTPANAFGSASVATVPVPTMAPQAMVQARPMMPMPMPMPPASALPPSAATGPGYLITDPALMKALVGLRDAPLPSQREISADQLAEWNWRTHPVVLVALVNAAKNDPAPSVRAGSIRVMAQMKADTPEVIATIRALKDDKDERVRREVAQALPLLGGEPITGDKTIRPASAP